MRIGIAAMGLGETGGTTSYARELVRALAAHGGGDECVLLLGPDDGRLTDQLPQVREVRMDWPSGRVPAGWKRRAQKLLPLLPGVPALHDPFSRAIDALGLDVVHYPATRLEELTLRTPAVLTFFDMQEEFLPRFFPLAERVARRRLNRRAVARARMVVSPSAFTTRCLQARYRLSLERVAQVPVGVADRFRPNAEPGDEARLRDRYPLPEGPFLLYPAHPWPHKNHENLLGTLARLHGQNRRWPLVCTGRLPAAGRSVAELAAAAGLGPPAVQDLGFVSDEDMPALYRAARVLVFPSLFEGFGMPVLEAMACGLPVACSGTTALPEVAGNAARLFDPRDPSDIARAVTEAWEDESLRGEMRAAGLQRAREYAWARVVPRLTAVYRQAAGLG